MINHITGALHAGNAPLVAEDEEKPKSQFFLVDAELFEHYGELLERATAMYEGLSGSVARGEISGLECITLSRQLPPLIKELKTQRAKLLRRRRQDTGEQSVLGKVFGADTITRNAAAVAMNKRLSNQPSRRA